MQFDQDHFIQKSIQNFAFEDQLVRSLTIDGAPWFVGRDLCNVLSITNHQLALETLDEDERGGCSIPTPGGDQSMIIVSEPGVYRLLLCARKPEAVRFKRWLAHEVLPRLRRADRHDPDPAALPPDPDLDDDVASRAASVLHRLQLVREARALFGNARAQRLWGELGLPDVPAPPATAMDEAKACLRHILDAEADDGGPRVRQLIEQALDDDEHARLRLACMGLKTHADRDGFVVANRHRWLTARFEATRWSRSLAHVRVIRRLPGAVARHERGTWLPAEVLDTV